MMRPLNLAARLTALALLPALAWGQSAPAQAEPPATAGSADAPASPSPSQPPPAAPLAAPLPGEAPPPAQALRAPVLEPPRWRLGITFGAGTTYGHSYMMIGGLVGYGIGHGFELYLDGQYWGGASPSMGRLAPGVNWYAPIPYRPYLGVFYARWIVGSGQPDLDAVGGRAGVTIASTPRIAFGAGVAYERLLDCSAACESFWPEMTFGFLF